MRFLFCSLSSPGWLYPAVSIALALQKKNHEVAFVTAKQNAEFLNELGLQRIQRAREKDGESFHVSHWGNPYDVAIQVKHIDYALEQFKPDVLVGQPLTLGPTIVSERTNLPLAVIGLANYLWAWVKREPQTNREGVLLWRHNAMMETYNKARRLFKLPELKSDPRESPLLGDLFLLQSVKELYEDVEDFPEQVHFIGSCLWESPHQKNTLETPLKSAIESRRPVIYVQCGPTFDRLAYWPEVMTALAQMDAEVFVSTGRMTHELGPVPQHFHVAHHIAQEVVLPHANLILCGGSTTTMLGSLVHGVPAVMIPAGSEHDEGAARCLDAGNVSVLPLEGLNLEIIAKEIQHVLSTPGYKERAMTFRQLFAEIDGPSQAAHLIEKLGVQRT